MYKVLIKFRDDTDKNHIYNSGDVYPRDGAKPTKKRIDYLLSNKTSFKKPVIEKVEE